MKKLVRKMIGKFIELQRRSYYKRLRKRLTISAFPTIISSDCIGGVISHNLGLRFCSPTVNLYFSKEDFIVFLENLQDFLCAELCEIKDSSVSFPVGMLQAEGGQCVKTYFMHYSSFEEAKQKWNKRKQRVDYDNLVVIWLVANGITEEDINRFDRLPYRRKLLITSANLTNSKNVVVSRVFDEKYWPGKILNYPSRFSIKRYVDEIDYVSLLNTEP